MKKTVILIILVVMMLIPATALASDVSNADYLTTVYISNNSTSAVTSVAVPFTLSTEEMIDASMLNSSANDSAMRTASGVDVAFQPSVNSSYPWITYIPTISGKSQLNQYLYTGGAIDGKLVYFPAPSGMSVSDDASMELGDNFTVNMTGFFDTTENITASMLGYTEELLVDGDGDATGIDFVVGAATHWDAVNEAYGSPSDAEYVREASGNAIDYFTTQNGSIPAGATVDNVTVYFRITDAGADGYGQPILRLAGNNTVGTNINAPAAFTTYSETLTRPGGGDWQVSDISDLQVGIQLTASAPSADCSQISIVVAYHFEVSYILSDTEAELVVSSNTTHLAMIIDDVSVNSTSTGGAAVADNVNDWVFCATNYSARKPSAFTIDGTMLYLERLVIEVDGISACDLDWEYDTTFTDDSGNSNDAIPTFRTTGSSGNVTANITAQVSTESQGETSSNETDGWTMITSVPAQPDNLYTSGGTNFPGGPEIEDLADNMRLPYDALIVPIAIGTSILAGVLVFAATYRSKVGSRGSMVAMSVTSLVVIIIWVVGGDGVIPGWIIAPYALVALLLMFWRNPYSTPIS